MYTASPPGNSRRFSLNLVGETVRKFLNTLWNTYSFFVTYANLSDVDARPGLCGPRLQPDNLLDRWVLSELNLLVRDVDRRPWKAMMCWAPRGPSAPLWTT